MFPLIDALSYHFGEPKVQDTEPRRRSRRDRARTAPFAAAILRVALGSLFLAHAGLRVFVFTPAGTAQFFGSLGLPPALACIMMAIEVIGGVALVLGLSSRVAALVLIPGIVGAIATVHSPAELLSSTIHIADGKSRPSGSSA